MSRITKLFDLEEIPVYLDPLMKDNEILKGRKQNSQQFFYITNVKIAALLLKQYRKKKLQKINNETKRTRTQN